MNHSNTYIIIGASGFIGQYLIKALNKRKYKIIALTRNKKSITKTQGVKWVLGNIEDRNVWDRILIKDAILIHLAYSQNIDKDHYFESLRWMIKRSKKIGLKKIIYCSTAAVVGKAHNSKITELTKCLPVTQYERNKLDIENIILNENNTDLELIIIRPTVVFGKGGENLRLMINRILHASKFNNFIARSIHGERKLNLLYVENLISVIMYFIDTEKIYKSEVFIVSEDDEEINNYFDIEKLLRETLLKQTSNIPIFKTPVFILRFILFMRGRSNTNPNRIYCNDKLLTLGIKKPYSLEDAIQKYALAYKKQAQV